MPVKIIPAIKRDRMLRRPGGLYAMRSPFCEGLDAGPGFAWGQWGTRDGAVRFVGAGIWNLQLRTVHRRKCSRRLSCVDVEEKCKPLPGFEFDLEARGTA